jgi:hypothetical protein
MKTLLAPLAVAVALTCSSSAFAWVTPGERAVIRHEVRTVRYDVRRAGPVYTPVERHVIRHDVRDVRRDIYRARRW